MKTLTATDAWGIMERLGVTKDDILFVHADLPHLGQLEGGVEMVTHILRASCACVVMPTFNFEFCDTGKFDIQNTPSALGVLSEAVRLRGRRTSHPTESVSAWGRGQVGITLGDVSCAYDPGGAFERLYQMDAKLLFLGVENYNETMIHYAERIAGVPYRYYRWFEGSVCNNGSWSSTHCIRYVRDMKQNVTLSSVPIAAKMDEYELMTHFKVNYGQVSICRVKDWIDIAVEMLEKNPYALVVKL
jgi:aminoglycoside 3-N-acetyltransferase